MNFNSMIIPGTFAKEANIKHLKLDGQALVIVEGRNARLVVAKATKNTLRIECFKADIDALRFLIHRHEKIFTGSEEPEIFL